MTRNPEALSKAVEDFLKTVYALQTQATLSPSSATSENDEPRVSTNALAEALNILPPSVTDMARRMASQGLVHYRRYYGVRLTEKGEQAALNVIRRHRLIELYLVEHLGYALHEVHDEAERLEHAVSDRFIEAITVKMGDPTIDPHGDPIPSSDGQITQPELVPLTEFIPGQHGRIARLVAENDAMLQHITERGFHIGADLHIENVDPFDGPVTVQKAGETSIIGYNVARCILLERL